MSRLTTTEYGAFCSHINTPDCDNCEDCKWWLAIVEKLARYEDLEEQGRLIEQKHGQWKSVDFNKIMCSECNHIWNIMNNEVENFKYCPNCGVKMDKVK